MQQAMRKMRQQGGFTLIELVVVVAILGVLAVIVTPKVLGAMENARGGANKTSAKQVQLALERILAETGKYPLVTDVCGSGSDGDPCTTSSFQSYMSKYVNLGTNYTVTYVPAADRKSYVVTMIFTDRDDKTITVNATSITETP